MVVCVLAFGIAHMMQGWRGVLGTGVIALLLHGIVFSRKACTWPSRFMLPMTWS
jgi:hypothetical protein